MEVGIRIATSPDVPVTRQSMEELAHVYGLLLKETNPHTWGEVEAFYKASKDPRTADEAFQMLDAMEAEDGASQSR